MNKRIEYQNYLKFNEDLEKNSKKMTVLVQKNPEIALNRLSQMEKRIVITKRIEEQGAEKTGKREIQT